MCPYPRAPRSLRQTNVGAVANVWEVLRGRDSDGGTPMRIGYLDELKMVQLSDGEIPYARPGLGLNILGRLAKQAAG